VVNKQGLFVNLSIIYNIIFFMQEVWDSYRGVSLCEGGRGPNSEKYDLFV